MNILRVLSTLMNYPDKHISEFRPDMLALINAESTLSAEVRENVSAFLDHLCHGDIMDHQENYIGLFDRGRSLSLLLFEHVHGESRDRGQAMVNLLQLYQSKGLTLDQRELPDYIPLYLEFLSQCPAAEALQWLREAAHIFALLAARLHSRQSQYAVLFEAILDLIDANIDMQALIEKVEDEKNDQNNQALDEVWQEEAVRFMTDKAEQVKPHANQNSAKEESVLQWVR